MYVRGKTAGMGVAGVAALFVVAVLCGGCALPVEPYESSDPHPPRNLVATLSNGRVRLQWDPPSSGLFSFYRIYRTVDVDSAGRPVTASMVSEGLRDSVDPGTTMFMDVPGPEMLTYYYGVRAVRIRRPFFGDGSIDTLEGPLSNIASVTIGTRAGFAIMRGVDFVDSRLCTLFVYDPERVLASARFTNVEAVDSNGTLVPRPPRGAGESGKSVETPRGRFDAVVGTGYLSLQPGRDTAATTPWFAAVGDEPAPRTVALGGSDVTAVPWVLTRGRGKKRVYAELTYRDGRVDTLLDYVNTRSIKIELVLRNSTETRDVRDTSDVIDGNVRRLWVFNGEQIEYSVKIFGDPSINPEFHAFLLFPDRYTNVGLLASSVFMNFYITTPLRESLTGRGDLHVDETVYRYPFTEESPAGREAFATLAAGAQQTYKPAMLREAGENDSLLRVNASQLDSLTENNWRSFGRKGFMLFLRFTESVFEDELVYVLGMEPGGDTVYTERDVYLPHLTFQTDRVRNPAHIANGDTLNQRFSFALDSLSIVDRGFARINEVGLIIARKPEAVDWGLPQVRSAANLALLREWPHETFPFVVEVPRPVIASVRWDDIDPADWTSGEYLMAVFVRDEYGREGLARAFGGSMNPWLVHITTRN